MARHRLAPSTCFGMLRADRLLLLRSRFFGFLRTRAAQHPGQRVVPLVAGVLEDALVAGDPWVLAGPRAIPRLWILDREPVQQRARVDAANPFHDVQLI